MCAQREMVVLVSREARQVEDDELDGAFVRAAELQKRLQFCAIGRLGTLAFFAKSREHVEALSLAVFLAVAFSCVGRLRFAVCSLVLTRT